ncbi:MAG: hypothetical protein GPOALKHO_001765 [Sodalis sp.]|nr:MAG: hypothetical protein GPOALKHO_001765 [Sodalis sp.]
MASPKELGIFTFVFSSSEDIIDLPTDIYNIDVVLTRQGLEVEVELSSRCCGFESAALGVGRAHRLRYTR